MYPIPPTETLIQTKTCRHCQASFPITDKDLEFYKKVSPVFNGKRYLIPPPTLCPDCRQQRRLSFRNEWKLYKRKCDATHKDIISIYSPDKPFKVYHQDYWWSDKWDPMDYGRNFDFGRGFFEQFGEMMREVPRVGLLNINCENSEFNHSLKNSKNCYLCFWNNDLEDVLFSAESGKSKDSSDLLWAYDIHNSYEISNSDILNSCMYCEWCSVCYECVFCVNCSDCKNCLFCYGLSGKEYQILNIQYTREEYIEKLAEFRKVPFHTIEGKKILTEFVQRNTHKYTHSSNIENSSGDYIFNVKNVFNGFNIVNTNAGRNIYECWRSNDLMDGSYVYDCAWNIIECIEALTSSNANFSYEIDNSQNIQYSSNILNSSHLFGCIGLRNKQYCILNKQYTREEYEALVPRIIEHMMKPLPHPSDTPSNEEECEWGEFFPSSLSPFWYNETVAMEYYPLTRDQISESRDQNGKNIFNWSDYEAPFPKVEKIIPADKLPDDISKIPDDILNWAIECEVTKKPFRIIKQELEFYRKHHLPIPRRHPDQRHLDRMALRNPRKLFERKCDKCGMEMITTYAPERKEVVYCEGCYNKEVVG